MLSGGSRIERYGMQRQNPYLRARPCPESRCEADEGSAARGFEQSESQIDDRLRQKAEQNSAYRLSPKKWKHPRKRVFPFVERARRFRTCLLHTQALFSSRSRLGAHRQPVLNNQSWGNA